ncbi:CK1/CK1/CK1-D protein kinase, partial [Puccinia triticina 1-1 BBBD Race 1]
MKGDVWYRNRLSFSFKKLAHNTRRREPTNISSSGEKMALTFGNTSKYRLSKRIGNGSFGEIYLGHNIQTGEEVAIKLESVTAGHPVLPQEAHVYRHVTGMVGVPTLRWFGVQHGYSALVLDMLGPSLEDLFNYCNRSFSLKTVLLIAEQLLCRLEQIHSRGFLHRDIKPENFLLGLGRRANQFFIIDFGLSKRYRDASSLDHIPYAENLTLTGTARYASMRTHQGIEQSRRDDLVSLSYMLIYFMRGSLPWQGVTAETKEKRYKKILGVKQSTAVEALCHGLPSEFEFLVSYANSLRFMDKPDYGLLRGIFRDLFIRRSFTYDRKFDWDVRMHHTGQVSVPTIEQLNSRNGKTRALPKPVLPPMVHLDSMSIVAG